MCGLITSLMTSKNTTIASCSVKPKAFLNFCLPPLKPIMEPGLFFTILFATILCLSFAGRNVVVQIDDLKCLPNPKYVNQSSCYVHKSSHSAYIDLQMIQELTKFQYSIDVTLIRNKDERHPFLQSSKNEGCRFFEGRTSMILIKIARDMLSQSGKLPKKCPVDKDFHFLFKEFRIDANKLPPLLPEGVYEIVLNLTQGKDNVAVFSTVYQIISKSKA